VRVFGLTPGRTGSATFVEACRHATNYTAGHETRSARTPLSERLAYPDHHIEADRHLSFMLASLDRAHPSDVLYVHLWRDPEATAASWVRRMPDAESWPVWLRRGVGGLVKRRHRQTLGVVMAHVLFGPARRLTPEEMLASATAYVEVVHDTISAFVADRPSVRLDVDDPSGLAEVWERADVEGDFEAALAEYRVKHNAG
jgi:hypothetical protein